MRYGRHRIHRKQDFVSGADFSFVANFCCYGGRTTGWFISNGNAVAGTDAAFRYQTPGGQFLSFYTIRLVWRSFVEFWSRSDSNGIEMKNLEHVSDLR
jgi:hypothetical protein